MTRTRKYRLRCFRARWTKKRVYEPKICRVHHYLFCHVTTQTKYFIICHIPVVLYSAISIPSERRPILLFNVVEYFRVNLDAAFLTGMIVLLL